MLFTKKRNFVKLIDFGFANFCRHKHIDLHETKGTPYYISPEVLKGNYDERCDLWSMGVVAFYLLSGKFPFMAPTNEKLKALILTCDYEFDEEWQGVSLAAKKFIRGLIEPNLAKRLTCEQALQHPWIQ